MNRWRVTRQLLLALYVSVFACTAVAQAQTTAGEYEPRVGQQGKDVVWVPTPQELVDKMLDMAKVTPDRWPAVHRSRKRQCHRRNAGPGASWKATRR